MPWLRLAPCLMTLVVAWYWPGSSQAGDRSLIWHTLESQHFSVHYYEPLLPLAQKTARAAEYAHSIVVPALGHDPGKTHIVLTDDTDTPNGFANVVPRNVIKLYATAPSDESELGDYDDWLTTLIIHEYTHIVHLDTMSTIPVMYNRIFGKKWAPNQILPRWFIEGLATVFESAKTSAGRVRNARFHGFLRTATISGQELSVAELTHESRTYPHGNAAYMYGSAFLRFVADRYGDDVLRIMSHDYGSRLIPYGVNKTFRAATGKNVDELYQAWARARQARYGLDKEAVDRSGFAPVRRLTFRGESEWNPMYTADGAWLVYGSSDGYHRPTMRRISTAEGARDNGGEHSPVERFGTFDLFRDGSFLFEQTRTYDSEYNYQDLFWWQSSTRKTFQLTRKQRASDPTISPDELAVAYCRNTPQGRILVEKDLFPPHRERVLWAPGMKTDGSQVFSPVYAPDGKTIVVSLWQPGGSRNLWQVDRKSRIISAITKGTDRNIDPALSPDGKTLVYASDRSGIFNLYAIDLATGKNWQLTSVLGGALLPAFRPDGKKIAYQGIVANGFDIFEIDVDRAAWQPVAVSIDDRPVISSVPDVAISTSRPYRPSETLAPLTWEYQYQQTTYGQTLSLSTQGNDVAEHHSYNLATDIGLVLGNANWASRYSYSRFWPTLQLAASRLAIRRGDLKYNEQSFLYNNETWSLSGGVGLPVLREPERSGTIFFEYDLDVGSPQTPALPEPDPNTIVPKLPKDQVFSGVSVRWSYSTSRSTLFSLGSQRGYDLSISFRLDREELGSRTNTLQTGYRGNWYTALPILDSNLAVRASGGLRIAESHSNAFALGGVPDQQLTKALLDEIRASNTGYLRGYAPGTIAGTQFHLVNSEWRIPLAYPDWGVSTLPFYFRRVHAALLLDVGSAFASDPQWNDIKLSAGASLRSDFLLAYTVPATFDLGYARGLFSQGQNEWWLLVTGAL